MISASLVVLHRNNDLHDGIAIVESDPLWLGSRNPARLGRILRGSCEMRIREMHGETRGQGNGHETEQGQRAYTCLPVT